MACFDQARKNLATMLFRGASSMLRRQDPSAIEQRVDLSNLACELGSSNSYLRLLSTDWLGFY
jgi:hypothetical protein